MGDSHDKRSFEEASSAKQEGLVSDLCAYVSETKKWWLLPILIVLGLLGVLVVLAGTGALPFLYTLF